MKKLIYNNPESKKAPQIPIFDSLSHPTLSGSLNGRPADFKALCRSLRQANFVGACAVGLATVENYEHELFILECSKFSELIPIAGINLDCLESDLEQEMDLVSKMGFKGVKVHPRISKVAYSHPNLAKLFVMAERRGLVVFLCTYAHCKLEHYPNTDPFYEIVQAIKLVPRVKVILVHGGDVSLLRYAELVRFSPNLLLDLSMTFMKYSGSSIDLDLQFLFNSFDQRICIGSDHPEYSHKQIRQKFNIFAKDLPLEKAQNIASKNILTFLSR